MLLAISFKYLLRETRKMMNFQQSRLFIIFLSEASVIDSKYIKMTELQDFY